MIVIDCPFILSHANDIELVKRPTMSVFIGTMRLSATFYIRYK